MKQSTALAVRVFGTLATALLLAVTAGCEDKDYRHHPADGKGALLVDNRTGDDIRVYVDGVRLMDVDMGDNEVVDVNPGDHRVTLLQSHGDRHAAEYVDVLEGELTVMTVDTIQGNFTEYGISVTFE